MLQRPDSSTSPPCIQSFSIFSSNLFDFAAILSLVKKVSWMCIFFTACLFKQIWHKGFTIVFIFISYAFPVYHRTQFFALTLSRGRYHIETSPLICSANQWTGFYMITASVLNGLKSVVVFINNWNSHLQKQDVSSVLIFFFGDIFDSTLDSLFLFTSNIIFNVFSLSIFNTNT